MSKQTITLSLICGLFALTCAVVVLTPAQPTYAQGVLPTATPDARIQAPAPTALPTPQPDYTGVSQVITSPVLPHPTFLPLLMRKFRPQAPKVGVAIEGFFDAAGWQQALALQPRYMRRYVEIAWRDVEPQEGTYLWETLAPLEAELKTAAASDARPIINVQMTPEWAQKVKGNACGPVAPEKLEAFAKLMEQLVQRYGSNTEYGVRFWQIGNEPDIAIGIVPGDSVFGCWGDRSDPYYGGGYYGEMLKVVYPRIKAADSNAQVMMGGLLLECDPYTMTVPETCKNEDRLQSGFFLEGILKSGAGEFFDVLDVHGYGTLRLDLPSRMHSQYAWSPSVGGTGLPEKVAFARKLLAQYGQPDKSIVTTEVALKCEEPSDDCQEVGAAYIPRVYAEAHQLGLDFAIFYALITEFKYKGLLLEDFTPKQQYRAFQYMATQLSWVEYVQPVDDYPGISGAEFNRSRLRELWIVWSTDGTQQYLTPPAGFVQVTDKYGNVLDLVDGKIPVDWSPVYVRLKFVNQ